MDPGGKAHVFVDDVDAPQIDEDDLNHLRVLRLQPADFVTVADGAGNWRRCSYDRGGELHSIGPIEHDPAPRPALTVAFAVMKGDRTELAVQKLTELGIDRIVPFEAQRSVVRWGRDQRAHQHARMLTIARMAAMQSRRSTLPVVEPLCAFGDAIANDGAALADRSGSLPSLEHRYLVIGPEGGWTPEERDCGLPAVRLGSTVLRAETAAIAAGVILAALREGLVASGQT